MKDSRRIPKLFPQVLAENNVRGEKDRFQARAKLIAIAAVVLCLLAEKAGAACSLEGYDRSRRPGAAEGPAEVTIGLFLVDISDVSDVTQSFTADVLIWLEWEDPELGKSVTRSDFQACRFPIEDVWHPEILMFNRRDRSLDMAAVVTVDSAGTVTYRRRFQGQLRSTLDLRAFPLDRQVLPLTFLSMEFGPDQVRLRFDEEGSGHAGDYSVAGWTIEDHEFGDGTLDTDNESFVRFDYRIHVRRAAGYYFWRAIVPLTFIVIMSWAVFWIDPSMAGVQIGLAATSILTLVAFLFSLNAILPTLSYLTRLDLFLLASLAIVFLAFMQAVATAALTASDRAGLAVALDRKARWLFPVLYGLTELALWMG